MRRDVLYYENRISILKGRKGAMNGNIIKKQERKIRLLEKAEAKND